MIEKLLRLIGINIVTAKQSGDMKAIHISKADRHTATIAMLRVVIGQSAQDVWYAQGVEIDYAASGVSLEDVKKRFAKGLAATVHANIKKFGTIDKMLKWAPPAAWEEAIKNSEDCDVLTITALMDIPREAVREGFPSRLAFVKAHPLIQPHAA